MRTRFFVPVPQVTLHVDHEDQVPQAQLTKHQIFQEENVNNLGVFELDSI